MKLLFQIACISLFFIASGCQETQKVIETAGRVQLDGQYNVTEVNGVSNSGQTILFSGLNKQVSGQAACNTYFAGYTLNSLSLKIGAIAATKKACPKLDDETAFLDALSKVAYYNKANGVLNLLASDNETVLVKATY